MNSWEFGLFRTMLLYSSPEVYIFVRNMPIGRWCANERCTVAALQGAFLTTLNTQLGCQRLLKKNQSVCPLVPIQAMGITYRRTLKSCIFYCQLCV
ncbi:hypothetical protein BDA96_02G164200 [Sorghum bicolor]|uniref:Uncharacterized protein n=2 Tax=Sorghum bicolor TaxID=4558 RepID=A0A921RMS1_SORBI|nr:hypothetical protein BDA96_02G164200 [Sorghum bicolor]OQU89188.1 hypothetical protein SORBI_3002G157350 [Sorghum bicolor]